MNFIHAKHFYFSTTQFYFSLPSTPRSSTCSIFTRHQRQIQYVFLSSSPHVSHAPSISFSFVWSPEFYLMRCTDQTALHCEIFPICRYLLPLSSKYLPQHPILEHPQPIFLPQFEKPGVTHTHTQVSKTKCKMIFICTLIPLYLRGNMIKIYNIYCSLS